ncbi:hypothetical protein [Microlunatus ginsengisoli]|uniref:Uncharacterized protein n=1 Tax=Microlunatus ginsengisoli TaxID=363863 RepID=A0ABP6ZI34_9ACTN
MGLRESLLELLTPSYEVVPVDADGTFLITRHGDRVLDPPARLQLSSEATFEQYVTRLATTSGEVDADAAVGLVYVHIDESMTADTSDGPVSALGLRSRRFGGPRWFVDRLPAGTSTANASAVWVSDPPES